MDTVVTQSTLHQFTNGWKPTTLPFRPESLTLAQSLLNELEFPNTRVEAWKYTRVTKISKQNFAQSSAQLNSIEHLKVTHNGPTLVFVNGFYNVELSTPIANDEVIVEAIEKADQVELGTQTRLENNVFSVLNTAFASSGAHIILKAKANFEQTIQILAVQTGDNVVGNLRNKITAEKGSKGQVVMAFLSENANACFTNVLSEIEVHDNANLTIDKLQVENESALHIATEQVKQGRDAYFKINTVTLNGLLVRNDLNIDVIGQNADTHLNGVYLGQGSMHIDNHTVVDHLVPNCESNELYKGVMDGKSTAVFNGKVFVRKDAQKINAFQSNGNVLLSNDATVNSKPELEIYADDVKCSHGSTTGQLDEEAIFYLRSRGISAKAARKLMVSAFVGDALEKIENEEVSQYIFKQLNELFGWDF